MNPYGLPPHGLCIEIGAPVMLLKNLEQPRRCNITRHFVKKLLSHVIEATVLTGCGMREGVFLPRISFTPPGTEINIALCTLLFPLRLYFGMSLTKSQGQTLSTAGLYLRDPWFSQGQLYVGSFRMGSKTNSFAFTSKEKKLKMFCTARCCRLFTYPPVVTNYVTFQSFQFASVSLHYLGEWLTSCIFPFV